MIDGQRLKRLSKGEGAMIYLVGAIVNWVVAVYLLIRQEE